MSASSRPKRASLVPLALSGFATGVGVLQTRAELPPSPWAWIAAAALLAMAVAAIRLRDGRKHEGPVHLWNRAALASCTIAAALAGFGYAALRAEHRLADALPPEWEGADIAITGVVDDLPDTSERGVRFAFAVERVETPEAHVPSRVSLVWPAARVDGRGDAGDEPTEVPDVAAGERWRLIVRLKRPHGYANPGGFDLEAWLLERNLRATGYVRGDDRNLRLDAFAGRASDHVQRARERVRDRIAAALDGERYAGVVAALAIGDQRAIPDDQWTVFNRTGVGHLVSISGLHVTALAALAAWAVARLARRSIRLTDRMPARNIGADRGRDRRGHRHAPRGRRSAGAAHVRDARDRCGGPRRGAARNPGVLWLWALAVVLSLDPWAVLAPGFALSYGAVAVLIYAGWGRVATPHGQGRLARFVAALREGARTQWAVTVGLVPFALALFGQVSLVSPIANAVAIPLVTLAVVPLAVAGIVVPVDACFIGAHALLVPLMHLLDRLAAAAAGGGVGAARADDWTIAAAAIGVVWLLAPRGIPGRGAGRAMAGAARARDARTATGRHGACHRARRRAGTGGRS